MIQDELIKKYCLYAVETENLYYITDITGKEIFLKRILPNREVEQWTSCYIDVKDLRKGIIERRWIVLKII